MDTPSEHSKSAPFILNAALEKLKRAQNVNTRCGVYSGICFATAVIVFLDYLSATGEIISLFASLGLLALGAFVFPSGYVKELQDVVALHNVESIRPLLDIIPLASGQHRYILKAALIELLPLVRPEDAPLFNTTQRSRLTQSLLFADDDQDEQDTAYRVAVLKALKQIGDGQALQHVQYLAKIGQNHLVQMAAQECLATLTARIERQKAGKMLLRSSSASEPPAELLRPVTETKPADEKQLLRAGEGIPHPEDR